ncbi:hypothetical protein [Streptomyces sp. ME18-1-4]|uniref:hypothetical protein n=1 Tax=Streptomyces sp. ME18-1-4 TaxID=3028685 RepID=UPI0029BEA95F|nr:hypothetical protein [Streptomyces sp. ME18-1-4]MDX3245850.1 hypothetical protein [Streptomyces sp. ME18-1-4]
MPEEIRHTYEVTFTSAEAKRVRRAARESGLTTSRYLHELALTESVSQQSQEVVVHLGAGTLDKAALARVVEEQMLRLRAHGPFRR